MESLLRELEADPGNRGLLAVLADQLQLAGDPRGELITLDLAASTEPEAMARRRALCLELAPAYPKAAKPTWGIGFLRKLEMPELERDVVAHPSCRLLESLTIGTFHRLGITIPDELLPRSLRTLLIKDKLDARSELSGLPHLKHVMVLDCRRVIHQTLSSLSLYAPDDKTLDALDPEDLPALRTLRLDQSIHPFLERITKWLPQLDELELDGCIWDDDSYDTLEEALDGRKLRKLTVVPWHSLGIDQQRLAALCEQLAGPAVAPVSTATHVTHEKFGRGRILRELDGKLEIEFPTGKRTLKDGPYLKRSRD